VCLLFTNSRISRVSGSISTRRKPISIQAELLFVNGDEAKKLVNKEGYKILDVRDKTQFKRAHIKSCYHIPLFIENNDNDLGVKPYIFPSLSLFIISNPYLEI
jgi:Rhodanese-like domain